MIIHQCTQGSPEWLQLRLGIPTASEFHRILSPTGKRSTQSQAYMHRLLAEWLTGAPLENIETQWMQRGSDLEEQAVRAYEFAAESETQVVGFITNDAGTIGCSPDRLVGEKRGLELKCPAPQTHIGYLLAKTVDEAYKPQVQGCLYITEREGWDVCSYYPTLPLALVKVERDENYIDLLADELDEFCQRLETAKQYLIEHCGAVPQQQIIAAKQVDDPLGFDLTDEDVATIWKTKQQAGSRNIHQ